jgi:hypothetical protein
MSHASAIPAAPDSHVRTVSPLRIVRAVPRPESTPKPKPKRVPAKVREARRLVAEAREYVREHLDRGASVTARLHSAVLAGEALRWALDLNALVGDEKADAENLHERLAIMLDEMCDVMAENHAGLGNATECAAVW